MTYVPQRLVVRDGRHVTVVTPGGMSDTQEFESDAEAVARAAIVEEALTWIGTPFVNCCDVKGPKGGVDCAMSLIRWYADTGRIPNFDPRPYSPQWFLHQDEERFLGWIVGHLGAEEIEQARIADVIVYKSGRCYAHGTLYIGNGEVVHAHWGPRCVLISQLTDTELFCMPDGPPRSKRIFRVPPR